MSRPGITYTVTDRPPGRSVQINTGTAFIIGLSDRGPLTPTALQSYQQKLTQFGPVTSYAIADVALEAFFREGGSRVIFQRLVGPGAIAAFSDLTGTAGTTLRVAAKNVGEWGNTLKREIIAGTVDNTKRVLIVRDANDVELERSPELATDTAFVTWSQSSTYVNVTKQGGTGLPGAVASATLAGGTDDRANLTTAQIVTALAGFSADLGPGQVLAPGFTTTDVHTALLNHARDRNRFAQLDLPDTASKATLKAATAALRTLDVANRGEAWGPWLIAPGTTAGTTRDVPPSVIAAALKARSDATTLNPNEAAAGDRGTCRFITGVKVVFTDTDIEELSIPERAAVTHGSVNVFKSIGGQVQAYGIRTLVDPLVRRLYLQSPNVRLDMAILAELQEVARGFVFRQIDGRRQLIAQYGSAMAGVLNRYFNRNALYGNSPDEAFRVEVGAQVNTEQTIADGQLNAAVIYRRSQSAEEVRFDISRVATDQPIAA